MWGRAIVEEATWVVAPQLAGTLLRYQSDIMLVGSWRRRRRKEEEHW